jgi:group I intron endonuclease
MSDIPTTAGVYCILNEITGKVYIGSAVNLQSRKHNHFSELARGCHHNRHLQNSVAKYGLDVFSFHVIELVYDKTLLIQREQVYIDEAESHKSTNGYNLCAVAGSTLGVRFSDEAKENLSESRRGEKNHMWGKHLSDEHRQKLSEAHHKRGCSGAKSHMWGKKHSDETKAKMVEKRLRWWKRYYAKRDELQLMLYF